MAREPRDQGQKEQSYDVWSGSGLVLIGVVLIIVSGPAVGVTFVAIGAAMLAMSQRSPFHGRG